MMKLKLFEPYKGGEDLKNKVVILIIFTVLLGFGCISKENDNGTEENKVWPNSSNTGIPADTPELTVITKTMHTTKEGEVIDALDLQARLYVDHPNVTIKRSKLSGDIYFAVYSTAEGTGLTIEDCDITSGILIKDGFTGRRNHLHAKDGSTFNDGWSCSASHVLFEDNLIDGMVGSDGAHLDGIQIMGGDDIVIRNNWIEAVSPPITGGGVNAAIMIAPDLDEITNVVIDGNMLIEEEGYYPLRVNARGKVEVINNRFRKGHLGSAYHFVTTAVTKWSNNQYEDGEEIGVPEQVKMVESVNLSMESDNVKIGSSTALIVAVKYDDGSSDTKLSFCKSSDTTIATVTDSGVVKGISAGEVTIKGVTGGKIGEIKIKVVE